MIGGNKTLRLLRTTFLLVGLVLLCIGGLVLPQPGHAAEGKKAHITVSIWPDPSIAVSPGDTISYRIRVKNDGDEPASYVQVNLVSYPPMQLTLVGASFESNGDWVSNIGSDLEQEKMTVTFSTVYPQKTRAATIQMRVSKNLSPGSVIKMWTSYTWIDSRGLQDTVMSNSVPVLVGNSTIDSPWIWMAMEPEDAKVGSTHHVFSDRFHPGEEIHVWMNTSSGTALPLHQNAHPRADSTGAVSFEFNTRGFFPGQYILVARGSQSDLIGLATFKVEPGGP